MEEIRLGSRTTRQCSRRGSICGWEGLLGKGMATPSRMLAWAPPWTEEPGGLQSMGWKGAGHELVTKQQAVQHLPVFLISFRASPVAQAVKNPPAAQETQKTGLDHQVEEKMSM